MRILRFSKRHKYNAQKTKVDNFTFDSKMEADYYKMLKLKMRLTVIKHIDVHPIVTIEGIRWKIDFIIYYPNGKIEAIDIKGFQTAQFKDRRKLFDILHPLAPLKIITRKGGKWYASDDKNIENSTS